MLVSSPLHLLHRRHSILRQSLMTMSVQLVQNIIESLIELKSVEQKEPCFYHCGEKVLKACFFAGKHKATFEEKEQLQICSLLSENIKKIDACIFSLGFTFDPDRGSSALVFRSGLQFILDNFKSFPTETGDTLEKDLACIRDSESLESFDEAIQEWKESTTVGWGDIDHCWEDLKKPLDVPDSHTWWF